jgi:hypothetical protein
MEVQAATTIAEWDIHGIYIYTHIYIIHIYIIYMYLFIIWVLYDGILVDVHEILM